MAQRRETIGDTVVLIDEPSAPPPAGAAGDTLVFLHGWPDSVALWDRTITALAPTRRCARFTWPGFGAGDAAKSHSLDDLTALLHRVVQRVGGGEPVTLVAHDWGCVFGYHYARRHANWVRRIVGVDIGDAGSPAHRAELSGRAKAGIAAYQLGLALAWRLGQRHTAWGDALARRIARWVRVPHPSAEVRAAAGYPYALAWSGGYKALKPFDPTMPMLFVFGAKKPFMFHSTAWAKSVAAREGSRVKAFKTGHWVMLDAPQDFVQTLVEWLGDTDR